MSSYDFRIAFSSNKNFIMNMNVLQSVTPIKHESKKKNATFTDLNTNNYFDVNEWQDGEDVPDSSNIFVTPPPCNVPPVDKLCPPPQRTAEARKSLFQEDSMESVNKENVDNNDPNGEAVVSHGGAFLK